MQQVRRWRSKIRSRELIQTLVASGVILSSFDANALPSFSRQTGNACNVCHTQSYGPNLTPFGRDFKLGGYTMGGGKGIESKIPISAMVTGSFTNTQKNQPGGTLNPGYNQNNNFTFDQASLFYAGKVYGKVGSLTQLTYNGYDNNLVMDNADIRFADRVDFDNTKLPFDLDMTYGISLNNNPTTQDLWNTTPAWGFPYASTGVQPSVGTSTMIEGALSSQVGGATAYTMINNLLYLEAGAYGSFSSSTQRAFGIQGPNRVSLDGAAPYWRAALQHDWKGHYFSVGHYGMSANVVPGRDSTFGSNRYTDLAMDATYQYLANPKHIFEAKTTYIYEYQQLRSDQGAANITPSNNNTYLGTYKLNLAYTFQQTYGITFGYNKLNGSNTPPVMFDNMGNILTQARPNSQYYTAELVYVPFGKTTDYHSLLNLRTALQYIGYSQANGTATDSQFNNTFMVNGALAF